MKRILYATDGSEGACAAGRFLSRLSHQHNVHVHIVTVLGDRDASDGGAILAAAECALGDFPGHVTQAVGYAVSPQEIVDVLLATAAYADADLILVGACGRSAMSRLFVGSVAEGVVRNAERPVLVVRPEGPTAAPPSLETIVGVDGSERSRAAAFWVASVLPRDFGICLARIVPVPLIPITLEEVLVGSYDEAVQEATRGDWEEAHCGTESLAQELSAKEARPVEALVKLGDPANALNDIALERHASLIVVATREAAPIERFLLGSVADRVLLHACCSVLIFRSPQPTHIEAFPLLGTSGDSCANRAVGAAK